MQSSPIQTQSIVYGELSIVPYMPEGDENSDADGFDWAGVKFDIAVKYDVMEKDGRPAYPVFLRIRVPNNGDGKKAPYAITAAIMGGFIYSGDKSEEDALDLVVVNGLSILYSSLREMILTTTSRMINGACIFLELILWTTLHRVERPRRRRRRERRSKQQNPPRNSALPQPKSHLRVAFISAMHPPPA